MRSLGIWGWVASGGDCLVYSLILVCFLADEVSVFALPPAVAIDGLPHCKARAINSISHEPHPPNP